MPTMVNRDVEHLKLLSVFHYVIGGLLMLFGLFPLFYVLMGVMFINLPDETFQPPQPTGTPNVTVGADGTIVIEEVEPAVEDAPSDFDIVEAPDPPVVVTPTPTPAPVTPGPVGPPPGFQRTIGYFFIGFGILVSLMMLTMAAAILFAGYKLGRASNWTYCLVIACLECLWIPFGTVLGVFTIVVLNRATVKDRFAGRFSDEDDEAQPPPLPG